MLAAAGCASGPPKTLRFDVEPVRQMRTWPHAPGRAALPARGNAHWASRTTREPGGTAKPAWRSALEWLAGLGGRWRADRRAAPAVGRGRRRLRPHRGERPGARRRLHLQAGGRAGDPRVRRRDAALLLARRHRAAAPVARCSWPMRSSAHVVGLDGKGAVRRAIGAGEPRAAHRASPSTGERGELYVADTAAHDVKVFDARGPARAQPGAARRRRGRVQLPDAPVRSRAGELYVDRHDERARAGVRARRGSARASSSARAASTSATSCGPRAWRWIGEGNVYVVESYYDHLLVFDREGDFLLPIGGTRQGRRAASTCPRACGSTSATACTSPTCSTAASSCSSSWEAEPMAARDWRQACLPPCPWPRSLAAGAAALRAAGISDVRNTGTTCP